MKYGKKGTIAGFRFKKSYDDYQKKGKPATRAYFKKKSPKIELEDESTSDKMVSEFAELVSQIDTDLYDQVITLGIPKQAFISADVYFKIKQLFEKYPIRIVKHKYLQPKTIRFDWNENKYVKTPKKQYHGN